MTDTKTCPRCGMEFRPTIRDGYLCLSCKKPPAPPPLVSDLSGRPLSFRERQIAAMLGSAKSNKEIAWDLKLTTETVKQYVYKIFRKLDADNRGQVTIWAIRNNLTMDNAANWTGENRA